MYSILALCDSFLSSVQAQINNTKMEKIANRDALIQIELMSHLAINIARILIKPPEIGLYSKHWFERKLFLK